MTKHLFVIIFLLTLIFCFGIANAEFYTWEDESGVTHITNYPPPQNTSSKKVQIHNFQSDNSSINEDENITKEKKPEVTLYTKNDCPDCDKAREFLQSQNIQFTEYNMDNDPDAVTRRKDIDDSEDVPFAIINRNHVYGFSEAVYNRALKLFP